MTLMTQVREMISKVEIHLVALITVVTSSMATARQGLHGLLKPFFFMQCVIDAHLVAYNESVEKRLDNA